MDHLGTMLGVGSDQSHVHSGLCPNRLGRTRNAGQLFRELILLIPQAIFVLNSKPELS